MVTLCEQALAVRLWTVWRRLSNVARGAAEGLEGPAGTERLDPTQSGQSARSLAAAQPNPVSANWNSTKRPLVTSPNRPGAETHHVQIASIETAAALRNLP